MKKLILFLVAVAIVALFASCKKNCHCDNYYMNEVVNSWDQELEDGVESCADLGTDLVWFQGAKSGLVCY